MVRKKVVKSLSLSPSTLELGHAVIDMFGIGDNMESKMADEILSKTYACMADTIPDQTFGGLRFKVEFIIELEDCAAVEVEDDDEEEGDDA